jgi:hypothetical protein
MDPEEMEEPFQTPPLRNRIHSNPKNQVMSNHHPWTHETPNPRNPENRSEAPDLTPTSRNPNHQWEYIDDILKDIPYEEGVIIIPDLPDKSRKTSRRNYTDERSFLQYKDNEICIGFKTLWATQKLAGFAQVFLYAALIGLGYFLKN